VYLVAGLGNPGEEYEYTPHNLGFLVLDRLAAEKNIRITRPDSRALVGMGGPGAGGVGPGGDLLLAKPQTFMNLSGTSLGPLMAKHGLEPKDLILVYDELDLPWGEVRIRPRGRASGHNGVSSVIQNLGTEEFTRVRIGVHPGHALKSGVDYLLAPLPRQYRKELDDLLGLAAEAVNSIIAEGVEKSMTRFNRRAQGLNNEEE
jgi:peptidyl-tRNA hydrolase, PTH1 family